MTDVRHVLTIFAVDDVERAAAFYVAAFGWRRTVEVPVYVELELPGGMRVGLYERRGFGVNTGVVPAGVPRGAITGTELYLRTDDLGGAIERLLACGARVLSPRRARDWGDEVAYFADPDGNVIAVSSTPV